MKDYSDFPLAALIIHEQTHATIFLKNRIRFNEELATFIGNMEALQFIKVIKEKYGKESEYYKNVLSYRKDIDTFSELIHDLYNELNGLYEEDIDTENKLERREEIFNAFKERVATRYEAYFETDYFRGIENLPVNNAFIMSYLRYTGDLSLFQEMYEKLDFDLKKLVQILLRVRDYSGDPKDFLMECIEHYTDP